LQDNELEEKFFSCVNNAVGCVVTDRFANDTTGRYAAEANTDALRPILKIKTCQTTIEKVEKKRSR